MPVDPLDYLEHKYADLGESTPDSLKELKTIIED